jgi:uncharacterized protein (TIGR03083 family)
VISVRDDDCGGRYAEVRARLLARLRSVAPDQLDRPVPATPDWTVLDVVRHLVGLVADLNRAEFGDGDGERWTARQVEQRRERGLDELSAEWEAEAPVFEEGMRTFGYEVGCHFLADLLAHEADVRHALGDPGLPDDPALAIGLDWYLDVADRALRSSSAGVLEVAAPGDRWKLGAGPAHVAIELDRFEAFRALGGRRSASQLRALPWVGDPTPLLPALAPYPLPNEDLVEI